ncbi:SAM domain-containing protein SAMSN-1a [Anguilla rostrata]|uniref:SAM domain-containing protein SAMSN-1a n=1 Tax=Anguilla rostrata TaxID=7938 RepID=UPI0030D0FA30
MNLFCFSLEGSMDSLYEAVQDGDEGRVYTVPSRSCSRPCSPAVALDENAKWRGSERSISADLSQIHATNSKKKKRKPLVPKSMSDNEVLDNTDCANAYWQTAKKREDVVHIKNSQNEELGLELLRASFQTGEDGLRQLNPHRRVAEQTIQQVMSYGAWSPGWEPQNSWQQDPTPEGDRERPEPRGTLRRAQKSGRSKKAGLGQRDKASSPFQTNGHPPDPIFGDDAAAASCMGLPKKAEKRPNTPQQAQESSALSCAPGPTPSPTPGAAERAWSGPGAPPQNRQRWSTSGECPSPWGRRRRRRLLPHLPPAAERVPHLRLRLHPAPRPGLGPARQRPLRELPPLQPTAGPARRPLRHRRGPGRPQRLPRSLTPRNKTMLQRKGSNVSDKAKSSKPKRSTSFGRFDALRQHPVKTEENSGHLPSDGETGAEGTDPQKAGGLGKKMRAISMTMRRKMGKRHAKASFSEEPVQGEDDADRDHEGEAESSQPSEKGPAKTSNSRESLYSSQSSSSGVTSGSDGSGARDSLRLEEDVPYTGQFCGRARVHTDFVPSPYDSDSLKLKVGDIIDVIRKPPMGIWTGMLNNKVGSFKFIYVDVIIEEVAEAPKIRPHRRSKRPRPKTLQELLERLDLQEYASSLLLNGYQTVDDLRHLKEKDLIELNVWDPEHRHRLLAAAECLQAPENENDNEGQAVPQSGSESPKADQSDCPRDSGCYVTPESPDNSKEEETESQTASPVT